MPGGTALRGLTCLTHTWWAGCLFGILLALRQQGDTADLADAPV